MKVRRWASLVLLVQLLLAPVAFAQQNVPEISYDCVPDFLKPVHLYEPLHRKIFEVAGDIIRMGKIANPVTIKTFLPADEMREVVAGEVGLPLRLFKLGVGRLAAGEEIVGEAA